MSTLALPLRRAVTRDRWRGMDWQLVLYLLLLVGFGWLLGYSAGYGDQPAPGEIPRIARTAIWLVVGLVGFGASAIIDYRWLRSVAVPLYLLVIGLLVVTLLVGTETGGSQLSIRVGGLDFQFSEISKIAMCVIMAVFLVSRGNRVGRLSTIVWAGLLMTLPAYLVFRQPDLGTALVFAAVLVTMLFLGGAGLGWLIGLLGGLAVAMPAIIGQLHEYQRARLACLLDPAIDPTGACYQLSRALDAVGSGGLFGQGLTTGRSNALNLLPVQSTDFIFTVLAEELGFVGGVILLVLFALLTWRVLLIAWRAPDSLGRLVAVGVATVIVFQVVVNVGMVVGLAPVTGVPLPFITYGGASLVSLCIGLGLVESVRIHADRRRF